MKTPRHILVAEMPYKWVLFWKDTLQGIIFWDKISREWEELCEKV